MQLIVYPVIHLLLAGVAVWMVGRALHTGETVLNSTCLRRRVEPVRYWFAVALGCFLIYAFGSPAIYKMLE